LTGNKGEFIGLVAYLCHCDTFYLFLIGETENLLFLNGESEGQGLGFDD
jgi:hypothetical protein